MLSLSVNMNKGKNVPSVHIKESEACMFFFVFAFGHLRVVSKQHECW